MYQVPYICPEKQRRRENTRRNCFNSNSFLLVTGGHSPDKFNNDNFFLRVLEGITSSPTKVFSSVILVCGPSFSTDKFQVLKEKARLLEIQSGIEITVIDSLSEPDMGCLYENAGAAISRPGLNTLLSLMDSECPTLFVPVAGAGRHILARVWAIYAHKSDGSFLRGRHRGT